jgi:hypothetical protein
MLPPSTSQQANSTKEEGDPSGEITSPSQTRKRQASSGTRLNYLKTSGSLTRSVGSNKATRLHYDKWYN